jgi:hypothetical protein
MKLTRKVVSPHLVEYTKGEEMLDGGDIPKRRRKSDSVSRTTGDEEILALCKRRINLFTELGPVLRNPSPKNPRRAEINRANTQVRKRVKQELDENCEAICARVMQLFAAELGQLIP